MHELALVQSLVETVAEEIPRGRVISMTVEIGELAAVIPDALHFCFELCIADTRFEGATLHVIDVAAQARCRACDAKVLRDDDDSAPWSWPWTASCRCGGTQLELVKGDEIRLKHVEIVTGR